MSRPRLSDALDRADSVPLVVVSAPAGTGKTTMVAEWARTRAHRATTGWVTFDDTGPAFWEGVLDALAWLEVELPTALRDDLPGSGLGRRVMVVADAIARSPEQLTIVADGAELRSEDIARDVDVLLRYTGDRLRLVVTCRADPALPLYRYRLTDTVREIREAELAFTDDEAAALLAELDVTLSRDAIGVLNGWCRGWPVGLRFAARALVDREVPAFAVVAEAVEAGDIDEYIDGEVLRAQPPGVRRFLLDTSVPGLLCPGLVDEVGGPAAGRTLRELARSGVFVEAVRGLPGCYRYAPFFRDLLLARLVDESPERATELRRRVTRWFRQADHASRLLRHVAADPPRASLPGVPSRPRLPAPAQVARQREVGRWDLPVVEPLTGKEREVLAHLGELLTTEEIAEKMFVSVNTVRTHVRSILRKLGVNRRNAAVRKARALGLLVA